MFAKRLEKVPVVPKKLVVVAAVVVVFTKPPRNWRVPIVVVALIRASARAFVKYWFVPSATFVVKRPRDGVASCWYVPPAYEPRRIPAAEGFDMPVPPPPAVKMPESVFANVRVLPAPVMVVDAVKPLKAVDDVAKVIVGPV